MCPEPPWVRGSHSSRHDAVKPQGSLTQPIRNELLTNSYIMNVFKKIENYEFKNYLLVFLNYQKKIY